MKKYYKGDCIDKKYRYIKFILISIDGIIIKVDQDINVSIFGNSNEIRWRQISLEKWIVGALKNGTVKKF